MSLWLRDIPVPPEDRIRLRNRQLEATKKTGLANHRRRLEKQDRIREEAAKELGEVTKRDLFIAGVAIYAAEGSKQKPWHTGSRTVLINSDPRMITLFLGWLRLIGVPDDARTFRVAIHETADADAAIAYWARVAGVSGGTFLPTTLKHGNPKTRRRNIGPRYRGCLVVGVKRSTNLTRRIDGWFDALVRQSGKPVNEQLLGLPTTA